MVFNFFYIFVENNFMDKFISIKKNRFFYKTQTKKGFTFTEFYQETKSVLKRVSLFSKPELVDEPIVLFTIDRDSKDVTLTKKWWKKEIKKCLKKMKAHSFRKKELENDELV